MTQSDTTDALADRFMTVGETADFLQVSKGTLFNWRRAAIGPRVYEVPNMRSKHGTPAVRYRRSDLVHFMETGEPQAPRGYGCGGCTCGTSTETRMA